MDWLQLIVTVVSTFVSLAGFMAGLLYWFKTDLKENIHRIEKDVQRDLQRFEGDLKATKQSLESDMQRLSSDIKEVKESLDAWTKHSTERSDQLYQMFIDLLKEQRKPST